MGQKFCAHAELDYNESALTDSLINLIDNGICLRTKSGCIGGLIFPLFMSGEIVAQEFFWWSEDGKGKELLEEFEKQAKAKGATSIIMVSLAKSGYTRVSNIYQKRGYELLESNYIKRI